MLPAAELLTPTGRLNAAALWPGVALDDVVETVDAYLADGYNRAAAVSDLDQRDEAARQWAYYRAWIQKYDDLSAMPGNVSSAEEGSATYNQAQIDSWRDRASSALVAFEALLAVSGVSVAQNRASFTQSVVAEW